MRTSETRALLTPNEVAAELAVSRATVYRWISAGELQAVRVGGSLRIDPLELREYVFGPEGEPR